jgi:hypothetical protein
MYNHRGETLAGKELRQEVPINPIVGFFNVELRSSPLAFYSSARGQFRAGPQPLRASIYP